MERGHDSSAAVICAAVCRSRIQPLRRSAPALCATRRIASQHDFASLSNSATNQQQQQLSLGRLVASYLLSIYYCGAASEIDRHNTSLACSQTPHQESKMIHINELSRPGASCADPTHSLLVLILFSSPNRDYQLRSFGVKSTTWGAFSLYHFIFAFRLTDVIVAAVHIPKGSVKGLILLA